MQGDRALRLIMDARVIGEPQASEATPSPSGGYGDAVLRTAMLGMTTERLTMNGKALRPDPNREPTHPGALLREDVLPAIGEPAIAVAKTLGVTRQHLHRVLAERGRRNGMLARWVSLRSTRPTRLKAGVGCRIDWLQLLTYSRATYGLEKAVVRRKTLSGKRASASATWAYRI